MACPGCLGNHRRAHPAHTYRPGECKWFEPDPYLQGRERVGAHPRDPRILGVAEPTQSLAPPPPVVPPQVIGSRAPDLVDES
eukprot:7508779-Prorocentrum_lima.AAC.1